MSATPQQRAVCAFFCWKTADLTCLNRLKAALSEWHSETWKKTGNGVLKFNVRLCSKFVVSCCVAFGLSGCLNPGDTLNERQPNYIGKDANVLFGAMGMPQQEGRVAGAKFYTWTYQNSGSLTLPQYNTATYSGNTYGTYGSTNTMGTVGYTTYQTTNYNYNCVLRAFVDRNNKITKFDMDGNIGGCNPLVNRM